MMFEAHWSRYWSPAPPIDWEMLFGWSLPAGDGWDEWYVWIGGFSIDLKWGWGWELPYPKVGSLDKSLFCFGNPAVQSTPDPWLSVLRSLGVWLYRQSHDVLIAIVVPKKADSNYLIYKSSCLKCRIKVVVKVTFFDSISPITSCPYFSFLVYGFGMFGGVWRMIPSTTTMSLGWAFWFPKWLLHLRVEHTELNEMLWIKV